MKTALGWWFSGFICGALLTAAYAVHVVENPLVPDQVQAPRSEFGTRPPDCSHLYNVDKHKQWASCMGVAYIQKRNDL
ncbi:MAG: hypothetical protein V3S12_00015 [Acidiferrobacterales bacterium]